MNREIFGPESIFLPERREGAAKRQGGGRQKRAPEGALFEAQVSRLEKRTVVARAR